MRFSARGSVCSTSSRLATALDISKESPEHVGTLWQEYVAASRRRSTAPDRAILDRPAIGRSGRALRNIEFQLSGTFTVKTSKARGTACRFFDQAITALVEDLQQRGLDKDVTVCAWGEFGRTPESTRTPDGTTGRMCRVPCWLAAGCATGQVIGSTDRQAAEAKDRPVHFQEVMATLYNRLALTPIRPRCPIWPAARSMQLITMNRFAELI